MSDFNFRGETGKNGHSEAADHSHNGINYAHVMKIADSDTSQTKAPEDPRVKAHDELGKAFATVIQEESDPKAKNSWKHGENLRALGNMYLQSGDIADGRLCLQTGTEVMHDAPDKPKNADLTITEALVDFGQSLLKSPGRQAPEARSKDLANAEQVFGSVAERAKLEHRSPEDIAAIYQQKANTELEQASLKNASDTAQKPAYLAAMQNSLQSLNSGLEAMSNSHDNNAKMTDARLHAELGFAESELNKNDRNNWYNKVWGAGLVGAGQYDSAGDFKKSIAEFNEAKTGNNVSEKTAKDAELFTVLSRYTAGDGKNDSDAAKELARMQNVHPDWKVKF
jgi:hypothetical protein